MKQGKILKASVISSIIVLAVLGAGLTTIQEHVQNVGAITKSELNIVPAGFEQLNLHNEGVMTLDKNITAANQGMTVQTWTAMQGPVNEYCDTVAWYGGPGAPYGSIVDKYRDIRTADIREVEHLQAVGVGSETIAVASNNFLNVYGNTIWHYDP